ncbi:MAG: hypothetical protein V1744_04825, partial [Candidatus Altiarchaeota archaeon]
MGKGYIITWDALVALSFIVFLMLGFIGLQYTGQRSGGLSEFERLHSVSENALDTADKRGALEEIGQYWALKNYSYAGNLTKGAFEELIPDKIGYRLEAVDQSGVHVIYSSGAGRPSEEGASDQTRSFRIVSGYKEDEPKVGWTARAWFVERQDLFNIFLYPTSECCEEYTSLTKLYTPGVDENNKFYLMVPGGVSLSSATFALRWFEIPATTSTTSTTTTSTTTTTTIGCHQCPAPDGCKTGNWYHTEGDEYNYHKFTVDDGGNCILQVMAYTGANNIYPYYTNLYDIYGNWVDHQGYGSCETHDCNGDGIYDIDCKCQCQYPTDGRPQEWYPYDEFEHCNTYPDPIDDYRSCELYDFPPGEYQVMVDCWNPEEGAGVNLCPGDYYIYVRAYGYPDDEIPDYCPNDPLPTTTLAPPTTTTPTTLPPQLGAPCLSDTNCVSGTQHCAADYDTDKNDGKWCAPTGYCAHSETEECNNCFYESGNNAPDCPDDPVRFRFCDSGNWNTLKCPACGVDVACVGRQVCSEADGACDANKCSTDGNPCDYCGGERGLPGSDTLYDAICQLGVCGPGMQNNCSVCKSCKIDKSDPSNLVGSCEYVGQNDYSEGFNDIVGPNKCGQDESCDGQGSCVIMQCSENPTEVIYSTGCNPLSDKDCKDDASDGSAIRLSAKEHNDGEGGAAYVLGWDS